MGACTSHCFQPRILEIEHRPEKIAAAAAVAAAAAARKAAHEAGPTYNTPLPMHYSDPSYPHPPSPSLLPAGRVGERMVISAPLQPEDDDIQLQGIGNGLIPLEIAVGVHGSHREHYKLFFIGEWRRALDNNRVTKNLLKNKEAMEKLRVIMSFTPQLVPVEFDCDGLLYKVFKVLAAPRDTDESVSVLSSYCALKVEDCMYLLISR